jgi:excisionase family DNA binding protein
MSLILFVLGAYLWYTGRFAFGSLNTQGRHIKAAGAVLMLPAGGTFVLSFILGLVFLTSDTMLVAMINIMAMVEFFSLIAAVIIAYILIADPQNAPRLPGILGEIQAERRAQEKSGVPSTSTPASRIRPSVPSAKPSPAAIRPDSFGAVLTVQEAASYMRLNEADILKLIDDGKLAAARINYSYRIARSNLDELLNEHDTSVST